MSRLQAWQYIPTAVLDDEAQADKAKQWADGQRAQVARQWAENQRAQSEVLLKRLRPPEPEPEPAAPEPYDPIKSPPESKLVPRRPGRQTGFQEDAGAADPEPVPGFSLIEQAGQLARQAGVMVPSLKPIRSPEDLRERGEESVEAATRQPRATPLGLVAPQLEPPLSSAPDVELAVHLLRGIRAGAAVGKGGGLAGIAGVGAVRKVNAGAVADVAGRAGEAAEKAVEKTRRFFHGTGSAFDTPDAAKFDENDLFGPGYYLTSEPRVASSYAREKDAGLALAKAAAIRAKARPDSEYLARTVETQIPASNVRAVDVPESLNLLDFTRGGAMLPDEQRSIASVIGEVPGATPDVLRSRLYETLLARTGGDKARVNRELVALGYDGIRYFGGGVMPLKDAAGKAIEHDALVIFPESLPKIRNALSGTPMGAVAGVGQDEEGNPTFSPERGVAGMVGVGAVRKVAGKPTFFSQLQRTIEQKLPSRASVEQVYGLLRGSPVKADEIKWTGFDDFLRGKAEAKQPVSKDEALDFLKTNQVQIEEVVKGKVVNAQKVAQVEAELAAARAEVPDTVQVKEGSRVAGIGAVGSSGYYTIYSGKVYEAQRNSRGELVWKMVDRFGGTRTTTSDRFIRELQDQARYPWLNVRQNEPVKQEGVAPELTAKIASLEVALKRAQAGSGTPGKYNRYTLPGGENYRELLLTLPEQGKDIQAWRAWQEKMIAKYGPDLNVDRLTPDEEAERVRLAHGARGQEGYRSPHFNEPNVLAHVRFNDHIDKDGKKVLLVEEVQSDWHQAGRAKGYARLLTPDEVELSADDALQWVFQIKGEIGHYVGIGKDEAASAAEALQLALPILSRNWRSPSREGRVPDAPFTTTWPQLAMKRVLRWAAENGYDRVAWTTGAQQVDRYDLSKQVDRISYTKDGPDTWTVSARKGYQELIRKERQTADNLKGLIGKDITERILSNVGHEAGAPSGSGELRGLDLKVGGEGMVEFYDHILPSVMAKLGKKWGAKVATTTLKSQDTPTVHALDVTPEMRNSVLTEGQPLFAATGGLAGISQDEEGNIQYDPARGVAGMVGMGAIQSPRLSKLAERAGETLRRARGTPEQLTQLRVPEEGYAGNIKLEKFPPDVRDRIAEVVDANQQFAGQRRGVIPDEQAIKNAAETALGTTIEDWLKTRPGKAFNQEEAIALGQTVAKVHEDFRALAEKVADARKTGGVSPAMEADLADKALELGALTAVRSGSAAEAGRALRAFRTMLTGANASQEKAISEAFKVLGGTDQFTKWLAEFSAIPESDAIARYKMLQALYQPSWWDKLNTLRYASMLSSWKTHSVNMASNVAESLSRPLELAFAGYGREAMADVTGMVRGIPAGLAAFGETIAAGISKDAAQKAEVVRPAVFTSKAGRAIQMPLAFLQASDDFAKAVNRSGVAHAEAYRLAKGNPTKMVEILANLPDHPGILAKMDKGAAKATFTEDLGPWAGTLVKLGNTPGWTGFATKLFLPFIRTPANIFKTGIKMTAKPVTGPISVGVKLAKGDVREARLEASRTLIASLFGAGLVALAVDGRLSGDGPSDAGKRKQLEATGWQAHSVKVGNTWHDYTNLGPIAVPATTIAATWEGFAEAREHNQKVSRSQEQQIAEMAADVTRRIGSILTDVSYVRSVGEFFKLAEGRGNPTSMAGNVAASFLPFGSAAAAVERIADPALRQRENVAQIVAGRVPGLSSALAPEPTIYGQETPNATPLALQILLPWRTSTEIPDPVAQEVARLQRAGQSVSVRQYGENYAGAEQTPEQRRTLQRTGGQLAAGYLADYISRPEYQGLTDQQKATTLNKALGTAYELADLKAGSEVARDPRHQALLTWASTPQFLGVKGEAEAIRQQNYEIAQAHALLAEYRRKYGADIGEIRFMQQQRAAFRLTIVHPRIDSDILKRKKAAVDKQFGGALTQAEREGLVGAGNTVLPAAVGGAR